MPVLNSLSNFSELPGEVLPFGADLMTPTQVEASAGQLACVVTLESGKTDDEIWGDPDLVGAPASTQLN